MKPADAAVLVRGWFAEHSSTIERALAWYGVRSVEDRADLTHDVLVAGHVALLRGEAIDHPRAWLRDCARKHASNYRRKALRRVLAAAEEVVNAMPTPEQIVEHRELLRRLFDCIDGEAQGIIFDVRIDNLSWEQIARERQISVDHARYLFRRALAQMEEASAKDDSTKARQSFVLAIAMDYVFEAVRAEADDVPAEVRRRVWESLERRMDAVGTSAADPEHEPASSQRPSPISIQMNTTPPPPMSGGAIAGMVGGGVVLGISLGYLIHGALVRMVMRVSPDLQNELIEINDRLFSETKTHYSYAAIVRGLIALGLSSLQGKVSLAADFVGTQVPRGRKPFGGAAMSDERSPTRGKPTSHGRVEVTRSKETACPPHGRA